MSVIALARRITEFGYILLDAEFAVDARPHIVRSLSTSRKSISTRRGAIPSIFTRCPAKLTDYIALLEAHDYSYLMGDGGVIQIAMTYNGDDIERSRLSYHPCPLEVLQHDVNAFDGSFVDLIQEILAQDRDDSVVLRSPIRFDFDPEAAAESHPASHVTINDPSCRIAARAPLSFDTFMRFVLEHFYPEAWRVSAISGSLVFRHENECLSELDRSRLHISWSHRS
jgi:hypothetical protein